MMLTETPTGRISMESKIYKLEWLQDIVAYAMECGYDELSFQVYENGNVAFDFEDQSIEFIEASEQFDARCGKEIINENNYFSK